MRPLFSLALPWSAYLPAGFARFAPRASAGVREMLRLADGTAIVLRAARPEDGALIQSFVRALSPHTRYQRFFSPIHELTPQLLERFTQDDPQGAFTVLALAQDGAREVPVAMAQYVATSSPLQADFAVVVADAWQRRGLGRKLVETLICVARAAGIEQLEGDILVENEAMRRMMRAMGFGFRPHAEGPHMRRVVKDIVFDRCKGSPLATLAAQALERHTACH